MTPTRRRPAALLLTATLVLLAAASTVALWLSSAGYTSHTAILLAPAAPSAEAGGQAEYLTARIPSLIALVRSPEVLTPVARRLGVGVDVLRDRVTVGAPEDTTVLDVGVEGDDPAAARHAGEAVLASFVDELRQVEATPEGAPRIRATVVTPPTTPSAHTDRPVAIVALAVAALSTLAVLVALTTSVIRRGRRRRAAAVVPGPRRDSPRLRVDPESGRYVTR